MISLIFSSWEQTEAHWYRGVVIGQLWGFVDIWSRVLGSWLGGGRLFGELQPPAYQVWKRGILSV